MEPNKFVYRDSFTIGPWHFLRIPVAADNSCGYCGRVKNPSTLAWWHLEEKAQMPSTWNEKALVKRMGGLDRLNLLCNTCMYLTLNTASRLSLPTNHLNEFWVKDLLESKVNQVSAQIQGLSEDLGPA